jgi:hypothetical protein
MEILKNLKKALYPLKKEKETAKGCITDNIASE